MYVSCDRCGFPLGTPGSGRRREDNTYIMPCPVERTNAGHKPNAPGNVSEENTPFP